MKKLFIFLSVMLLSAAVMWGQEVETDVEAFRIYPSSTGTFEIWFNTYGSTGAHAFGIKFNNASPKRLIARTETVNLERKVVGDAKVGEPIIVYGNRIAGIYIRSKADWIYCNYNYYGKPVSLRYFYYLHENLSPIALENLYQGLNVRTGINAGELHLINNVTTANNPGSYTDIAKANGFVALEKNWYITSNKGYKIGGEYWKDRAHWDVSDRDKMQALLYPSITITAAPGETVKVGSMDIHSKHMGYRQRPISIVSRDNSFTHNIFPAKQESETSFSSTGMVSAKVASGSQSIKIYGASVTHLSCEKAFINQINTNELRYVVLGNSTQTQTPSHISNQDKLKVLNMYNSDKLTSMDLSKNKELEVLDLGGCTSLKSINIGSTEMKKLDLSQTYGLAGKHVLLYGLNQLTSLEVDNCRLDACQLDEIYDRLPSSSTTKYIKVSDLQNGSNANKVSLANHTIATAKKWQPYGADEGGNNANYSNDGGGCYHLYVADTKVTSANASRITGSGISGTVSYNHSTKTLTLNNATIKDAHVSAGSYVLFYGIERNVLDLKINLIGNNVIDIYEDGPNIDTYDDSYGHGISCSKNLTFSGTGSLHVKQVDCTADGGRKENYGIFSPDVTIDKAKVTIDSKGMYRSLDTGLFGYVKLTNGATLVCHRYLTSRAHPGIYSGAVLEEGNSAADKRRVNSLTLTKLTSEHTVYYRTKQYVSISPAGTGLESLSSHGITLAGGKGEIRITNSAGIGRDLSDVYVYNVSGALVRTAPVGNGDIHIAGIPAGIYIVRIDNAAEKVVVR